MVVNYLVAFCIGCLLFMMATTIFVLSYDSFMRLPLYLPAQQGGWDTKYVYYLYMSIVPSILAGGLLGCTMMFLIIRSISPKENGIFRKFPSCPLLFKALSWYLFLTASYFIGNSACLVLATAIVPKTLIHELHNWTDFVQAIFSYCGGFFCLIYAFTFRRRFKAWTLKCGL